MYRGSRNHGVDLAGLSIHPTAPDFGNDGEEGRGRERKTRNLRESNANAGVHVLTDYQHCDSCE